AAPRTPWCPGRIRRMSLTGFPSSRRRRFRRDRHPIPAVDPWRTKSGGGASTWFHTLVGAPNIIRCARPALKMGFAGYLEQAGETSLFPLCHSILLSRASRRDCTSSLISGFSFASPFFLVHFYSAYPLLLLSTFRNRTLARVAGRVAFPRGSGV